MCTEITDKYDGEPARGWVLYDAECSLCANLVTRVSGHLRACGFKPEPLQSPWVRQRLNLPEQPLLAEMRVLKRDGQVLGGADALVGLATAIPAPSRPWWAWLLVISAKLPFSMPILRTVYR